jgi:hypothetical protein
MMRIGNKRRSYSGYEKKNLHYCMILGVKNNKGVIFRCASPPYGNNPS